MMNNSKTKKKKSSFIDLFRKKEAGEEWFGERGYICTYTADQEVLKKIVKTFKKNLEGKTVLHLIAGAGSNNYTTVAGIRRLGVKEKFNDRTMHAKVCLLKFREGRSQKICYRVIVTTGNLTKSSWKYDLDMYWYNDYICREGSAQELANVLATKEFFEKLLKSYPEDSTVQDFDFKFSEFVGELKNLQSRKKPQFIYSIDTDKPLIDQILVKARRRFHDKRMIQPYLIVGSGFYSDCKDRERLGSLIETVRLFKEGVFRGKLECCFVNYSSQLRSVVPNPRGKSGILFLEKDLSKNEINFGYCPTLESKNLHAKYIFGSFYGPRMSKTNRGRTFEGNFIYIGSGNITYRGLGLLKTEPNIEAGVVLSSLPVFDFFKKSNTSKNEKLENYLPLDINAKWKTTLENGVEKSGTETGEQVVHCPISYLKLTEDNKGFKIIYDESEDLSQYTFRFQYPINNDWKPQEPPIIERREPLDDIESVRLLWGKNSKIPEHFAEIQVIDSNGNLIANQETNEGEPHAAFFRKYLGSIEEDLDDEELDEEDEEEGESFSVGTKKPMRDKIDVENTRLRDEMANFERIFRCYLNFLLKEPSSLEKWQEFFNDLDEEFPKEEVFQECGVNPYKLFLRDDLLQRIKDANVRDALVDMVKKRMKDLKIENFEFFGWNK